MLDKNNLNVEIQAVKKAMRKNKSLRMHKRYKRAAKKNTYIWKTCGSKVNGNLKL